MTTGRINQVARLKREPARQLRHRPGRAGPSQDANRKSLLIRTRGIPPAREHAPDTLFRRFVNNSASEHDLRVATGNTTDGV